MYEELYEKLDGTAAYFERLGLEPGSIRPDLEGLDRVLRAQLNHIPFDDMDVWGKGACPDLGIKALYEKIVLIMELFAPYPYIVSEYMASPFLFNKMIIT